MRVMPWEGSGRYSPGPGMVKLLEKWFYQELRPLMAICSINPPGNLAIVSIFSQVPLAMCVFCTNPYRRPIAATLRQVMMLDRLEWNAQVRTWGVRQEH